MVAQCGACVIGAVRPALLEQWHHPVDERVEPAGCDVRDEDESVAGIGLNESVDRRRDGLGRSDERLPPGDFDDQLARREVLRLGFGPPLGGDRERVPEHAHTRPAARDGVLPHDRVHRRQRPVRVMIGEVAVPELFEELDRRLPGHLGEPDLVGQVGRLVIGVADHERRGRQDEQLVMAPPVARQPALDVGIERLPGLEGAVPGEDGVRRGRRELAAFVRVARLEDHRAPLRAARHVEPAVDGEVTVRVRERAGVGIGQERPAGLVGHDLVSAPRVEQLQRRLQKRLGTFVALVLRQEPATAKVLACERIPRCHDVPGRATLGKVVQRRELPSHLVGLVEGRIDGACQSDSLGHRGQRRQHREGVRTPDDVEIVDLSVLLPQAQSLGQEEEVEFPALGRLREVRERAELDVAAGRRVAPHRGVVDARKVRREVNLLDRLAHWLLLA